MEPTREDFVTADGTRLAVHHMGEGRPVLLLHGLFSSADMNYIRFGNAAKLAEAGYHVVMPDFRVHGESETPQDKATYTKNIIIDDIKALIESYGWDSYDLGGFSLGARSVARLLTDGIRPDRAMLTGIGWDALNMHSTSSDRLHFFLTAIERRNEVKSGDEHFAAVSFMKSQKIDPDGAQALLHSFGDLDVDILLPLDIPIGVICGADDNDMGSGEELAQNLKNARYIEIPGNHMSCVTMPEYGEAMVEFLGPAQG